MTYRTEDKITFYFSNQHTLGYTKTELLQIRYPTDAKCVDIGTYSITDRNYAEIYAINRDTNEIRILETLPNDYFNGTPITLDKLNEMCTKYEFIPCKIEHMIEARPVRQFYIRNEKE